jgi:nucleoside-diphosphate-sugar epimerase
MPNKYLITGASGFIGSHLVELLLKKKISVKDIRLLVLPNDTLDNLPNKDFDFIYGDIRNKNDVLKAIKNVDIVYHLAAKTVFEGKTYEDFKDTNVDGTKNIVEASIKEKVSKFIFFSSIAVYGLPAFVGEIINWNEKQLKAPAEVYGESKLVAENIVFEAFQNCNLPAVIIRPSTVYGPRDHQGVLELYKIIDKGLFVKIGKGKNKVDYVYVKDLVLGAYQAQKMAKNGSDYILGGGKPITFNYLVDSVSNSINKKVVNIHITKGLALLVSYVFDGLGKAFGFRSPLFPQRVKVMTTNCYFDVTKARREIGYKPKIDFKEGAILTASWYKFLKVKK